MDEAANEFAVGGKEFERGKLGGREPSHLLEGERLHRARIGVGAEENQLEGFGRFLIGVARAENFLANESFDVEFLAKFTGESFGGRFARFEFAAGKFPKEAEGVPFASLANENFSFVPDEGGGDEGHDQLLSVEAVRD